jgi:ribose transport system permease protein
MAVTEVAPERAGRGARSSSLLRGALSWGVRGSALLAVAVVFSVLEPHVFPTSANLQVVLRQSAVAGLLAAGLSMCLIAGAFDLSFGATLALTGVLAAKMLNAGIPWPLVIVLSVGLAAAVGAINGIIVVRSRVPSLVVTLGTQSVLVGVVAWLSSGAYETLDPTPFSQLGRGAWLLGIPNETTLMLAVCGLGALMTRYCTAGRNLQAVGANPAASWLAGINVNAYVVGALATTGAFAGLGALVVTAQLGAGHPEAGPGYLLPAFAAAFIGASVGRGGAFSFFGAVYGAVLLTTLTNGLVIVDAPDWTQSIVTGVVLIAAVAASRALRTRANAA